MFDHSSPVAPVAPVATVAVDVEVLPPFSIADMFRAENDALMAQSIANYARIGNSLTRIRALLSEAESLI